MSSLTESLNSRWDSIPVGTRLDTPSGRSNFTVTAVEPEEILIITRGGTEMRLGHAAFIEALNHLQASEQPCLIESNKNYDDAGDLCRAARDGNSPSGEPMVITYVLPILQQMGLVEIDSSIPNTAWLTV